MKKLLLILLCLPLIGFGQSVVDRQDPNSTAKAILIAYKLKDLKTLSSLSTSLNSERLYEINRKGDKHSRYNSIWKGWRWKAVNNWDGNTLEITDRGMKFGESIEKDNGSYYIEDYVVALVWENDKLCFEDIWSPSRKITSEEKSERSIILEYNDTIFHSIYSENSLINDNYHFEFGGCCDGCWVSCPEIDILGWSKNGIVAYMTDTDDDYDQSNLIIQDLKTDRILNETSDSKDIINKYNIINGRLSKYYSEIPGFEIDLITNAIDHEDCMGSDVSYELKISNKSFGHKTVTKDDFGCVVDWGILGYLKSPFENRILILLYYVPEVDETEYYYIKSYGASLKPSTFK